MRFFLSSFYFVVFFFSLFLLWFLGLYLVSFFLVIVFLIILFLSRRLSPKFQEEFILKEGIFYSPVNARVVSVKKNIFHPRLNKSMTQVKLVSSWIREGGLYLPIKSEFKDLVFDSGKPLFRYFNDVVDYKSLKERSHLWVLLEDDQGCEFGLEFYKCPTGLWPSLRVIPGDRGKAQVNFGFFGLGGTTILYLPSSYEIIVKESLQTVAGQTIIGRYRDSV